MSKLKTPGLANLKPAKKSNVAKRWSKAIKTERHFLEGKYVGKEIASIVLTDPNYCSYILDSMPKSVVALQLWQYFNRPKA